MSSLTLSLTFVAHVITAPSAGVTAMADPIHSSSSDLEDEGFVDPRKRPIPRTHRLRLGVRSQYVELTSTEGRENGQRKMVKFHYAPVLLDLGYQLQFLRYFMARPQVHFGKNVANSRNAMPWIFAPGLHLGYQGRLLGLAMGYNYMVPFPALINATGPVSETPQPVLWDNHIVTGEVSATSRIDRIAVSAFFGIGAVNTDLSHRNTEMPNNWRMLLTGGLAFYFDGTIRRERKQADAAQARSPRPRPYSSL